MTLNFRNFDSFHEIVPTAAYMRREAPDLRTQNRTPNVNYMVAMNLRICP